MTESKVKTKKTAGRRKTKKPVSAKAKTARAASSSRTRKKTAPRSAKKKTVSRAAKKTRVAKKTSRRVVKKTVTKRKVAGKVAKRSKVVRKAAAKKSASSAAKKKAVSKGAGKRVLPRPASPKAASKSTAPRKTKGAAKSNRKPIVKTVSAARSVRAKAVARKTTAPKSHETKPRTAPAVPSVETPPTPAKPKVIRYGSLTIELAPEGAPLPKTKIPPGSLKRYTEKLLAKRRELVGDVNHLTREALKGKGGHVGGSHMPLHMADLGTDNWEQEFTLGLIDSERALLREIDEALDRIEKRTYGVCIATHRPIRRARLVAKPWAKYTIDYARLRELGKVP